MVNRRVEGSTGENMSISFLSAPFKDLVEIESWRDRVRDRVRDKERIREYKLLKHMGGVYQVQYDRLWTVPRYTPSTLFDVSGLPPDTLHDPFDVSGLPVNCRYLHLKELKQKTTEFQKTFIK